MIPKNIYFVLVAAGTLFVVIFVAGHYFFFTDNGSQLLARFAVARYARSWDFDVERTEGVLTDKLSLHNIVIKNAGRLPKGSQVKVQRLDLSLKKMRLSQLSVTVFNGRLKLPFSDTILFYGGYNKGILDLVIYSKKVSARELLDLFTRRRLMSSFSGILNDVNLHITGMVNELAMEGQFYIEKITKGDFSLTQSPGSVMMYCDDLFEAALLNGEIEIKSGIASGGKTATVKLEKSKIIFEGDPKRPKLNIRGTSEVEDVKISVILKGTIDVPILLLSSYPPLTQDLILVMLATGRSWGTKSVIMEQEKISSDLVRDFVDYFILGGKGNKIAQHVGINDISLTFDQTTKGVGVKTSLSDKVQLSYEVEPPKAEEAENLPTHTVAGQINITETVSVAAEKELKQQASEEKSQNQIESQTEDKVYLQFKKQF